MASSAWVCHSICLVLGPPTPSKVAVPSPQLTATPREPGARLQQSMQLCLLGLKDKLFVSLKKKAQEEEVF